MHQNINSYLAMALVATVALGASMMIASAAGIDGFTELAKLSN